MLMQLSDYISEPSRCWLCRRDWASLAPPSAGRNRRAAIRTGRWDAGRFAAGQAASLNLYGSKLGLVQAI